MRHEYWLRSNVETVYRPLLASPFETFEALLFNRKITDRIGVTIYLCKVDQPLCIAILYHCSHRFRFFNIDRGDGLFFHHIEYCIYASEGIVPEELVFSEKAHHLGTLDLVVVESILLCGDHSIIEHATPKEVPVLEHQLHLIGGKLVFYLIPENRAAEQLRNRINFREEKRVTSHLQIRPPRPYIAVCNNVFKCRAIRRFGQRFWRLNLSTIRKFRQRFTYISRSAIMSNTLRQFLIFNRNCIC